MQLIGHPSPKAGEPADLWVRVIKETRHSILAQAILMEWSIGSDKDITEYGLIGVW